MGWNAKLIEAAIPLRATYIGGMDCSFIPKNGKATYGLDWFYSGSQSRTQKGLEISVIAVIDVAAHRGCCLSVQQTPANLIKSKATIQSHRQGVSWAMIEQIRQILNQLPIKVTAGADVDEATVEPTRMDDDLKHLQDSYAYLPTTLKYWAVDGLYSKKKFVNGVVELNLQAISKLRTDADMPYLYTGVQNRVEQNANMTATLS